MRQKNLPLSLIKEFDDKKRPHDPKKCKPTARLTGMGLLWGKENYPAPVPVVPVPAIPQGSVIPCPSLTVHHTPCTMHHAPLLAHNTMRHAPRTLWRMTPFMGVMCHTLHAFHHELSPCIIPNPTGALYLGGCPVQCCTPMD